MDLRSVDKICLFPGQSLLYVGQGLQLQNLADIRRRAVLTVDTNALSNMMPDDVLRVSGVLPGCEETLKLYDSKAWMFHSKDVKVEVADAVVDGEFVVLSGSDWTTMKAGLRGTPKVKDLDAVNRRGIVEVKVVDSNILVRGRMTLDDGDLTETVQWWDDSFGMFSSAASVTVRCITVGLWPKSPERDFVREVAKIVSEDMKQSATLCKTCNLPEFCDKELLEKVDKALRDMDRFGRIKWNAIFPDVAEGDYGGGLKRLIKQLEQCLRNSEKKAIDKLIDLAKKIIERRTAELKPQSKTYQSHKHVVNQWSNNYLKRLELLRDKLPWSAGGWFG